MTELSALGAAFTTYPSNFAERSAASLSYYSAPSDRARMQIIGSQALQR